VQLPLQLGLEALRSAMSRNATTAPTHLRPVLRTDGASTLIAWPWRARRRFSQLLSESPNFIGLLQETGFGRDGRPRVVGEVDSLVRHLPTSPASAFGYATSAARRG